jgi:hypothetical protein
MRSFAVAVSSLVVLLLTGAQSAAAPSSSARLAPVSRSALCVTEGTLRELPGGRLAVNDMKMRAVVGMPTPPEVEARFTYLGGTAQESRLGSGAIRRQFGLKLRAQDACNLIYAMWRIEPESKLVVSVKSNPGQHSSAECGNRGYVNLKPRRGGAIPLLRPGDSHRLSAVIRGDELSVAVHGQVVWLGSVGRSAAVEGPVGIRSDNARLELELLAPPSRQAPACRPTAEAGD